MPLVGHRATTLIVVGSSFVLAGACASFSGTDETPGPDGGGTDAISEASDASDGVPQIDAGPNLLSNGDFELGCAGWTGNQAMLIDDSTTHSGTRSCRVCPTAAVSFDIVQYAKTPLTPGERYFVEAYLHAAPSDAATPKSPIGVTLRIFDRNNVALQSAVSNGPTPAESWQRISELIDVSADGGTQMQVAFESADVGRCFLIDDARLYRR